MTYTKHLSALLFTVAMATSALAQQHRSVLELNGQGEHLLIPSHPDFNIPPDGSYTISLHLSGDRTIIYNTGQRLISRRDLKAPKGSNQSGYELLGLRNLTKAFFGVSTPDSTGGYDHSLNIWTGDEALRRELRTWHHVAWVVDRTQHRMLLYIDGELQRKGQSPDIGNWCMEQNLPILIGAAQEGDRRVAFYGGKLDNIRFYRRALSPSEIREDSHTERISHKAEGLVAAYEFDNYRPGDTIINDVTGRHPAHLIGFPQRLPHHSVRTYREHGTNATLVGRGTTQPLFTFSLGLASPEPLRSLTLDLSGTTPSALTQVKLYETQNGDRFAPRSPGRLIATGKVGKGCKVTLRPVSKTQTLNAHSKLWVVTDVASSAPEGGKIVSRLLEVRLSGTAQPFRPDTLSRAYEHEIVLQRTLLWAPGENHSAHYRIPGIVRLNDGTLVASIDKRKNSEYDLPEDIDVEVKLSHDMGKTWSTPITVAKGSPQQGFGDAAMATDGRTIYMVMVSGSGLWHYPSQAKKPLQMYYTSSSDGGKSWSTMREISDEVYGDRFRYGGFFGSGNGIITSKGRIMFVAAMRTGEEWGGTMDNVLVYSDDQGKPWHTSPVARANGDESKVVELSDGTLLISSRNRAGGANARTFVRSTDSGMTWSEPQTWPELTGNACNAALARYAPIGSGKDQHLLLHTLPTSPTRDHLRLFLSEDEGKTWRYSRELCGGEAVYSELVILPDGSIGVISEEDDRPGFDIYFTRVSLDWLRGGKQH